MSIYLGKEGGGVNILKDAFVRSDIELSYVTQFKKYHPIIFGYYKNNDLDFIYKKHLIYFHRIEAFSSSSSGNVNKQTQSNYRTFNDLYVYPNIFDNYIHIEKLWVQEYDVVLEHCIRITIKSISNLIINIDKIELIRNTGNINSSQYYLLHKINHGYDGTNYFSIYQIDFDLSEPFTYISGSALYNVNNVI